VKTQKVPLFLRRTLSESANVLAIAAAQKSVELVVDVDPDVPDALTGNGLLLRQMIRHVAGNAVKFTERGEIVISAVVESIAADSVCIRFSVRDTGAGISPEQLERLFEPYEKPVSTDTWRLGDAGFGLAITRRLAALMGEEVWAESERGVGSTFHFTASFGLQETGAARNVADM
jgi:two-component system, sensor histidine kinase and response regulator